MSILNFRNSDFHQKYYIEQKINQQKIILMNGSKNLLFTRRVFFANTHADFFIRRFDLDIKKNIEKKFIKFLSSFCFSCFCFVYLPKGLDLWQRNFLFSIHNSLFRKRVFFCHWSLLR